VEKKLIIVPLIAILAGCIGLATIHYFAFRHTDELWFHLATHTLSLVGAAGIVGFAFEFFFRSAAARNFTSQILELFDGNSQLASKLSQQARQERVKITLEAQLGPEIGSAIYNGLVSRYLEPGTPYRKEFFYEAVLADLPDDVALPRGLSLKKDNYFKLTMTQHFLRPFKYMSHVSVGCILTDDFQEVNYWFSQANCIFRDTLVLSGPDREIIKRHLSQIPRDEVLAFISPILKIDKITIDGLRLEANSAAVAQSGNSVGIVMKVPGQLKNRPGSNLARYEIMISGIIAKEARKYPVILGEPTQDPEISLIYNSRDIERVVAAPFFTAKPAFEPRIETMDDLRKVTVSLPRVGEEHSWVFPNSGAIFLWDRRSA